jgi:hypothetical protein
MSFFESIAAPLTSGLSGGSVSSGSNSTTGDIGGGFPIFPDYPFGQWPLNQTQLQAYSVANPLMPISNGSSFGGVAGFTDKEMILIGLAIGLVIFAKKSRR